MTDYKALRRQAEAQGWRVETTQSGHLRWIPPPGGAEGHVISGGSHRTTSRRNVKNTIRDLRHKGFTMSASEPSTAQAEAGKLYLCVDCGYEHPYAEMARVPSRKGILGPPTRYCKKHFQERKSAGRRAQIETSAQERALGRAAAGAQSVGESSSPMGVTPTTLEGGGDGEGSTSTPENGARVPMGLDMEAESGLSVLGEQSSPDPVRRLETTLHEVAETLLSGLADLESRVDTRLAAIEQAQKVKASLQPLQAEGAAQQSSEVIPTWSNGVDLALTLHRFSQQLLWLATFDETLLPQERKYLVAGSEARKLAERLRAGDNT